MIHNLHIGIKLVNIDQAEIYKIRIYILNMRMQKRILLIHMYMHAHAIKQQLLLVMMNY